MVTKQKLKNVIKKSMICSLSAISVISLTNCNKGPSTNYIDNAIAIVYQDEKPYLINAAKQTYALDYYEDVEDNFNEYIAVKLDGKYGYINRTGKLIIQPVYDKVYPMYEEKAVVIKDGTYQIIDNNGNTLYTFTDNITSESYFENNFLVIKQGNKYGYLKYNQDTKEFTSSSLEFDYARPFGGEFAVVGKHQQEIIYKIDEQGNPTSEIEEIKEYENIKYNYIDSNFELLFETFDFDYADNFYNELAVVGYHDSIYVPGVDGGKSSNADCLVYKYINQFGRTLHFNHNYVFSIIVNGNLQTTNKTYSDEIYMPYAQSFQTDITFVAKYRYSSIQTYLKEYMLVTPTGKIQYTDAIYGQTGYLFGHDSGHVNAGDYQCQSPGLFSVGNVIKIKDTYAFIAGHTLASPSWKVYYIQYDLLRNEYSFATAKWDFIQTVTDEYGNTYEEIPQWGKEYKYQYLKNTPSNVLLKYAIENPYEMTDLSYSSYISDEYLVNSIRISESNHYGLVKYESSTVFDEKYNDTTNLLTASFIIDPIYDKIIY